MEENKNKSKEIVKKISGIAIIIILTIIVTLVVEHKFFLKEDTNKNAKESEQATTNKTSNVEKEIENNNSKQENSSKIETEQNEVLTQDVPVIESEKYELTFKGSEFSKKVEPPVLTTLYTYYEAKQEGHSYLVIKLDYKNLQATDITADDVATVKVKYNEKYEYSSFPVIVDKDGDFTYANITNINPLTVGQMYYLCDLPDEVVNAVEPIIAYVQIGSKTYEISIR